MKKYILNILMFCLVFATSASARIIYVSDGGSNTPPYNSWATSARHPNTLNGFMVDGDTAFIAPHKVLGVYAPYDSVYVVPPRGGTKRTVYACSTETTFPTIAEATALKDITRLSSGYHLTGTWSPWNGSSTIYKFSAPFRKRWNAYVDYSIVVTQSDSLMWHSVPNIGGAGDPTHCTTPGTFLYDDSLTDNGHDSIYAYPYGGGDPDSYDIRVSGSVAVFINYSDQDRITFFGLSLEMGHHSVFVLSNSSGDRNKADSIEIRYCNLKYASDRGAANNTGVIYFGYDSQSPPSSLSEHPLYCVIDHCNIDYAWSPDTDLSGGSGIEMYCGAYTTITNNWFGPNLRGACIAMKYGGPAGNNTPADSNVIANNFMSYGSKVGLWFAPRQYRLWVYGNYIAGIYRGIDIHSTGSKVPYYGQVHILNNTIFWSGSSDGAMVSIMTLAGGGGNEFMYNILYDITSPVRQIQFYDPGSEGGSQTPSVETYWAVNYNMYWNGSNTFTCGFSTNSSCTGTSWTSWNNCGKDLNGTYTTNPGFNNPNALDFSRPSAPAEMNQVYGGKTWTRFGAWQPTGSGCVIDFPVLSTPLNGAANLVNPIVFDWSDVATATSYTIQVATDAGFNNVVASSNPTASTYTSSVFLDGTQYYWRVNATSACGVSAWSPYRIFNMACIATPTVTLLTPANLATNQALALTLDWADVTSTLYQVQLSLSPAFSTTIVDATTASSTYNISSLNYAITYYWRVRAQNACGWGNWSTWSFTTLTAPTSGSETVNSRVAASDDDATYEGNTFSSTDRLALGNAGPARCSTYTIHAVNFAQGVPCQSAFLTFTPRASTSGTTCTVRIRGELTGNSATLTSGSMAARTYTTAYVDWTIPAWTTDVTSTSPDIKSIVDEITTLGPVTRIGFKVSDNLSSFDAFRTAYQYDLSPAKAVLLTVNFPPPNVAPTVPVLSTPANNGNTNTLTPTLTLTNSTDANGDPIKYLFEISKRSSFDTILVQSPLVNQTTTTTSWTSTITLENGLIYYWRARSYDGSIYSNWSAGNKFIIATTRLMTIDQTWRNSTNGVINTNNGFLTGDVVQMTSDIITPDNWGIIINTKQITLQGDGYTIRCNNITVPAVTNPGFESGTGTSATGWDFTDAPNAQRLAGQYDEISEYSNPSTLMSGSYSLRFQVPCPTQVVKSSSTYTLDANRNWCITAAYYNQIQNPTIDPAADSVRVTIGFVDTNGDTLFSSEYLRGMMYRGPEPLVVHFKTTSAITGKIFFRLKNTQDIISTNSFIWIDDVKILPFRPVSLGVAIDTTELRQLAQASVRAYNAAGDSMDVLSGANRIFSGFPTTSNIGDSTKIYNVVLRNNSAGGYGAYGLFYGYAADFIELHNSDVYTIGPNAFNIFSGSAFYNKVYNNIFKLSVPYCDARESVPSVNIDFVGGKGSGARGSIIYGNTFSGSIWCDIALQNRCDGNIDGIDTYPVPIVRKNTFYRKTFITNGFVVDFTGQGGMIFDSNFVYGADTLHGSGVHVQYQNPVCEQWVVISNNYIDVSPDTVNQEYPYGTLAYGIQLEEAPRCSVFNNIVRATTNHINDPSCSAIRINDAGMPTIQRIFGNQFIALSNNESNSTASCFQFGSPEGWDYDPATGENMEFYYNEFSSNSCWIRALPKMTNWQPNNNMFIIDATYPLMSWFTPLASSTVDIGDPTDIRFLNNRYGSSQAKTLFKNAYIKSDVGVSTAEAGSQYLYSHQAIVNIASTNTGLFLPDIEVYAYRNDMAFQDVDTTTTSGKVYLLVNEYEDAPLLSTYNVNTDRHNYNPFTIIARTINQALAETTVVTIDTTVTINMNLDFNQYPTTNSNPVINVIKPNSTIVLPPLFNADTMAHVVILDDFGIKSFNAYLRGGALNKNIYTTSNSVGSRPITQEIMFSYNTQYEDTLAQYLILVAEDDSLAITADTINISIPVETNITINFGGKYIKDTWIDANSPTVNRATSSSFRVTASGSRGWSYFDINALKGDSLPTNVDIVSAYIRGYCDSKTGSGTVGIYDVFKNGAMDTSITYNRFDRLSLYEWGTAGANNTGDYPACNYNTNDGSGCDRTASALYSTSPNINSYSNWVIPDSTLQFIFDGTKPNNGWAYVATSTLNVTIQTLEGIHQPTGSITYKVPRPTPVITNHNPVLAIIGAKSVTENQMLSFTVTATDQETTIPFVFVAEQTKPEGVIVTDNSNGSSLFTWTPTYRQAGVYSLLFIASDGELTDSETVQITVIEAGDQRPQLLFVTPQSVNENNLLSFVIGGWEPDGNSFVMTATGLPSGASFVDNADSTGTFTWTPNFVQSGAYNVSFIMTETSGGILADTDVCVITVVNVNRAPVLASIGNKTVNEGAVLSFNISATDADAQTLTFSTVNLPAGATPNIISNGNAQINWSPSFAQSGVYNTIFIVSDGSLSDSEAITITVNDVSGITSITISGTTNVEDSYLRPSQPNANYSNYTGGGHGMYIFMNAVNNIGKGIVRFQNIATLLPSNAIITNTYIKLTVAQFTRTGTLNAHRVFQPWVEGNSNGSTTAGVSYNHFDISGTKLWTTSGVNSASDAGVDNLTGTVGTHFDRTATAAGSVTITALGIYNIILPTSLVQGWRDGSMANNGVLLSTPNGDFVVYQSEFATSTSRPELVIEYTTVVTQPTKGRKHPLRGIGTGVIK